MDLPLIRRFSALFRGYELAHGRYSEGGGTVEGTGKVKGKGRTVHSPLKDSDWQEHLEKTGDGVGAIPLRTDDRLFFAAIDVDVYPLDHAELAAKAARYGLVTCRSKSGGAHLYAFFLAAQPAKETRQRLTAAAAALGHGGVEIFPKQSERASERDVGNWINLPYYGGDSSLRYAIDPETGSSLSLDEFLSYAESKRLGSWEWIALPKINEDVLPEGPPCLQYLLSAGGFPSGTRNDGLFGLGVYYRKAFPDDWEDRVFTASQVECSPPLPRSEVEAILKSLRRKDYAYPCKRPPLQPHCNKTECRKRLHGVGATPGGANIEITAITKYLGEPVRWCVEVEGARVETDTDTLFSHRDFSKICMERINKIPAPVAAPKWLAYLNEKLELVDEVPQPEEVDERVLLIYYVQAWLYGNSRAKSRDEMLLDKPWHHEGRIYFLGTSLRKKLDADRYRYGVWAKVWEVLRDRMDARKEKGINIRGNYREPWSVPNTLEVREEDMQFGPAPAAHEEKTDF
jgi:hypothetical protein